MVRQIAEAVAIPTTLRKTTKQTNLPGDVEKRVYPINLAFP